MASAGNHVWVGFIEALPVVGSVKESVEWILAVAADDFALAEEKLDVINGRLGKVEKLSEDRSSGSSSGYSSQSASRSSTPVGKKPSSLIAMPVERMNLMAYIRETVTRKQQQQQQQQQAQIRREKQEKIVKDETIRKILRIDNNFKCNTPLVDKGVRAGRGEHVINNGVIRFYKKVVKDYRPPSNLSFPADPLDQDTANAIGNELVADFGENEHYINANAVVYGAYSKKLKQDLTNFLKMHLEGWEKVDIDDAENKVTRTVLIMIEEEAYVDQFARIKWIAMGMREERRMRFEAIRDKVATMYNDWTKHFNEVIKK